VSKMYNISLLPKLKEQALFFIDKTEWLSSEIEKKYKDFLTFVDSKSSECDGTPEYERLQQVYNFASDRFEQLARVMSEETEEARHLHKVLGQIEESGDQDQWQSIATELLEECDYRETVDEFKVWVKDESAELNQHVEEMLNDWAGGIAEGRVTELALFLEALEDSEKRTDQRHDDVLSQCESSEEGCCSTGVFGNGSGCCACQTPCCQEPEDEH